MKKAIWIVFASALILFFGACAHEPENPPARYFADKGMQQFSDGDYREAIKSFEKLRDWFPFSKYTILADLKIADAHFEIEEYDEAAMAYAAFERLHPSNEAIPFVIYRIGLCHYNRLDTIDRDQTPAHKALETFNRLQTRFPGNEYTDTVLKLIHKCRKSLADHELYVGKFYYRSKQYKAAKHRFQKIITDFPEAGDIELARQYIALCDQLAAAQTEDASSRNGFGRIFAKIKEPFSRPPTPKPTPSRPPVEDEASGGSFWNRLVSKTLHLFGLSENASPPETPEATTGPK